VLGGFTTFSTFGLETWQLMEGGLGWLALTNAGASLGGAMIAVALGVILGRNLA
jgi:CrcB protein